MNVDLITVLLAGYAPMAGVVGVLWQALQKERADHMRTIRRGKNDHAESMSDLENRLAELENELE